MSLPDGSYTTLDNSSRRRLLGHLLVGMLAVSTLPAITTLTGCSDDDGPTTVDLPPDVGDIDNWTRDDFIEALERIDEYCWPQTKVITQHVVERYREDHEVLGLLYNNIYAPLLNTLTGVESESYTRLRELSEVAYDYTVQQVIDRLDDTLAEIQTRAWSARLLGDIAEGNQEAIDALIERQLSETEDAIRTQVAWSLEQIAQGNENAINTLIAELTAGQKINAIDGLEIVAKGNLAAIEALGHQLETASNPVEVRVASAHGLGVISARALGITMDDTRYQAAVPVLTAAMTSEFAWEVRAEAAFSLGHIGDPNDAFLFVALTRVYETDIVPAVQDAALTALTEIWGPPGKVHMLLTGAYII